MLASKRIDNTVCLMSNPITSTRNIGGFNKIAKIVGNSIEGI